jgi:hypothetical protein
MAMPKANDIDNEGVRKIVFIKTFYNGKDIVPK